MTHPREQALIDRMTYLRGELSSHIHNARVYAELAEAKSNEMLGLMLELEQVILGAKEG